MNTRPLPFSLDQLNQIIDRFPTPFHIYDEKGIKEYTESFIDAFKWNEGFKEYYAVKANPNPAILKMLHSLGCGMDCSSIPELVLAEKCGIRGQDIMLTSNNTSIATFKKAKELGAIINLDDFTHIDILDQHVGLPETLCFRYNPGQLENNGGNFVIGKPHEAKYGFTKEQLLEGYKIIQERGVKYFGLHTMVASNELDPQFFINTAHMMFDLAIEIKDKLGIQLSFINLGGGIGIPYKPEQKPVDLRIVSEGVKLAYKEKIESKRLAPIRLFMECGRAITGPFGHLISKVINTKHIYKDYVGLDASMANLMRPGMYEAYHHITVVNKQDQPETKIYDVTGSLCENNDKFAVDRTLPEIEVGDVLAIHDTGAHGYSMGFNYNGMLRSAELLLKDGGEVIQIRRAETVEDYFATLDFEKI